MIPSLYFYYFLPWIFGKFLPKIGTVTPEDILYTIIWVASRFPSSVPSLIRKENVVNDRLDSNIVNVYGL